MLLVSGGKQKGWWWRKKWGGQRGPSSVGASLGVEGREGGGELAHSYSGVVASGGEHRYPGSLDPGALIAAADIDGTQGTEHSGGGGELRSMLFDRSIRGIAVEASYGERS